MMYVYVTVYACVRAKNPHSWYPRGSPPRPVGDIFPPNCESMQIIPVVSLLYKETLLFIYIKGKGKKPED